MDQLFGPAGVVVGSVVVLINTIVAAWFASKNKHLLAAYKRLKRIEPNYLDLLEWSYDVEVEAARRGQRHWLPKLPSFILAARVSDTNESLSIADPGDESTGTATTKLDLLRRRVGNGPPQP